MTDLRTAAQLAVTMLKTGMPEYNTEDVLEVLEAALAEPCPCGDRSAAECPGEWEPGCDLGNNPKYAKRVNLAEPVQEPVAAWENKYGMKEWEVHALRAGWMPAPPQRKPLTEEEIVELARQEQLLLICDGLEELTEIARAIERAHEIGE